MDDLRERAALLLSKGVQRADLRIEFAESVASTSEVLVDGKNFYPRMLEDIAAATSSIHVNQFGFRPGAIGETFAAALLAKAGEGVHVRLVVDRQGSDPERSSRQFYDRRSLAGSKFSSFVRRSCAPSMARWANTVRRGGTSRSSGTSTIARWWWSTAPWAGSGAPGSRTTSTTVGSTTCFSGSPGVVSQLQVVFVATFGWLGGTVDPEELGALFPAHGDSTRGEPAVESP